MRPVEAPSQVPAPSTEPPTPGRFRHVSQIIIDALEVCGLPQLRDAMAIYLRSAAPRLIVGEQLVVDVLWASLSGDAEIPAQPVIESLVLITRYTASALPDLRQSLSPELCAAIEAALPAMADLEARLSQLDALVQAGLQAPAPPPEAAAPVAPPMTSAPQAAPADPWAHMRKRAAGAGLSRGRKVALSASAVVLLAVVVFWAPRVMALFHSHRAAPEDALAEQALAGVLPVSRVRVVKGTFYITTNHEFAGLSSDRRSEIAAQVVRVLNAPNLSRVQITSGTERFIVTPDGKVTQLQLKEPAHG